MLRVNIATWAPILCYVEGLLSVWIIFRVKIATRAPLLCCVKGLLGGLSYIKGEHRNKSTTCVHTNFCVGRALWIHECMSSGVPYTAVLRQSLCCSVLQYVAVSLTELFHVISVCWSVLQCVAVTLREQSHVIGHSMPQLYCFPARVRLENGSRHNYHIVLAVFGCVLQCLLESNPTP